MEQRPQYKAEFDFRELIRKPENLVGLYYVYFLFVGIAIGIAYISHLNIIGANSISVVVPTDTASNLQDIPMHSPRIISPLNVMKAAISSPESLEKGRELFKANCSSCHGDDGRGDGPAGTMMNPRPRKFHSPDGWTNGSKVSQIYKTLQDGIVKNAMPSFDYLLPEDRFGLIHFVRSFSNDHAIDTPEELNQLDATYGLSRGLNIPGQIPVRKAMQVIIKEADYRSKNIDSLIQRARSENFPGALLFNKVARDRVKIFSSLLERNNVFFNSEEFIKYISADPVQIGFRADVLKLSSGEWASLYHYLSKYLK